MNQSHLFYRASLMGAARAATEAEIKASEAAQAAKNSVICSDDYAAASTDRRALPLPCARLLSRVEAAAYVGVCGTTFDRMVKDSMMPRPKKVYGRVLWDVRKLDVAIDALEGDVEDSPINPWNE